MEPHVVALNWTHQRKVQQECKAPFESIQLLVLWMLVFLPDPGVAIKKAITDF